jgi:hypothetical protein
MHTGQGSSEVLARDSVTRPCIKAPKALCLQVFRTRDSKLNHERILHQMAHHRKVRKGGFFRLTLASQLSSTN